MKNSISKEKLNILKKEATKMLKKKEKNKRI